MDPEMLCLCFSQ